MQKCIHFYLKNNIIIDIYIFIFKEYIFHISPLIFFCNYIDNKIMRNNYIYINIRIKYYYNYLK